MFDFIIDILGDIADVFADLWINKIVSKFKKKDEDKK